MQLRYELANLLYKLKRFDEARKVAQDGIDEIIGNFKMILNLSIEHDDPTLIEVQLKILQAEIFVGMQEESLADICYINAKESLQRMLAKESGKQAVVIQIEISNVCVALGKLCERQLNELGRAGAFYSEAIQYNPENEQASILLSKIQRRQGNHAAAQNQLSGILEKNENSIEASLMMADILCEKSSFQSAFFHFRKILEKTPSNFEILADFINIAYRLDKLEEVPAYFENAKITSAKSKIDLGYHYCRGLYYRYTNSINEALKELVICRKDHCWGERALFNLIDIFLNPSNETIGGDALSSAIDNEESPNDLNADMDLSSAITADKLISVH